MNDLIEFRISTHNILKNYKIKDWYAVSYGIHLEYDSNSPN